MKATKDSTNIRLQEADVALKLWMGEARDLRAALDEHAIVVIADPQGRITFVNDKFCAISKYSRQELLGRDHQIISSGYHSKSFFDNLWRTIARGSVWHGEVKIRAKDGSCYRIAATIVPFLAESGQPRQFMAIGTDTTKQEKAESELAGKVRLQALLMDLSSRFVASASGQVDDSSRRASAASSKHSRSTAACCGSLSTANLA